MKAFSLLVLFNMHKLYLINLRAVEVLKLKLRIVQIIKGILQIIKQNSLGRQITCKNSFIFSFILSNLEIDVSDSSNVILQYSYGVFLLSLIALLSLINILGYIISYIIIQEHKDKYEEKYPRLKKIILFYKKVVWCM